MKMREVKITCDKCKKEIRNSSDRLGWYDLCDHCYNLFHKWLRVGELVEYIQTSPQQSPPTLPPNWITDKDGKIRVVPDDDGHPFPVG